jgi:hypothetical protein
MAVRYIRSSSGALVRAEVTRPRRAAGTFDVFAMFGAFFCGAALAILALAAALR